jgi:hypothetical protein
MAKDLATTYLTTIVVPGDVYTNDPDDLVAMPPRTLLSGTARILLVMLRREYFCPLPLCTTGDLCTMARGMHPRTIRRAIAHLVAGGYLHPLQEG